MVEQKPSMRLSQDGIPGGPSATKLGPAEPDCFDREPLLDPNVSDSANRVKVAINLISQNVPPKALRKLTRSVLPPSPRGGLPPSSSGSEG